MKKIFTLIIALGLITAADAQWTNNHRPAKQVTVIVGTSRSGIAPGQFAADRELRENIARINHKYEEKIWQVQHNLFMRHTVKDRKIRKLEDQRRREIAKLQKQYNQSRYKLDNHRRY